MRGIAQMRFAEMCAARALGWTIHSPGTISARRMLKRLITLLALLTGLAAAGAPAQAMVYDAGAGVELAAGAEGPCKSDACECPGAVRLSLASPPTAKACKPAPVVTVVIPTVQLGVDRAYE